MPNWAQSVSQLHFSEGHLAAGFLTIQFIAKGPHFLCRGKGLFSKFKQLKSKNCSFVIHIVQYTKTLLLNPSISILWRCFDSKKQGLWKRREKRGKIDSKEKSFRKFARGPANHLLLRSMYPFSCFCFSSILIPILLNICQSHLSFPPSLSLSRI